MSESAPWLAPFRTDPVDCTVSIPGSKSLTNRALILAAIAEGPSTIVQPLESRDTELMASALQALGVEITRDASGWTIIPASPEARQPRQVDCGLAGTVMRFVPPVAALAHADVTFDGDPRARARPMAAVIEALRALDVAVSDDGRGSLPFTVHGQGHVGGGIVRIDASASSQFVSALLLAGARYDQGIDIIHTGSAIPSQPHIDMTVAQLRLRGVEVDDNRPSRWTVSPGPIAAVDVEIEPDLSNAGAFAAAALVSGGQVTIRNWPTHTDQAGDAWREIVPLFGGTVVRDGSDMIFAAGPDLRGIDLDMHDVGELAPVTAAIAAFASSPSTLRGIAHLRGHETDRLAALATEINTLGGAVTELDDGLSIAPRPLVGGTFHTYDDHRMAHAALVIGLRTKDLCVENVATTAKTYPDMPAAWERLFS